jgi:hypothetical protein
MKTQTQIVKQDLADAVKNLNALLKRDFGCDYAFIIMGQGHYVARHNIQGVIEPVTEQPPCTCGHVERVLDGWKCRECEYQNAFAGRIVSHLKKVHNYGTKDAHLSCLPVYRNEIPV